ncbi:hypothetical protein LTR60_004418, partial [Cryomyces antarcticus]
MVKTFEGLLAPSNLQRQPWHPADYAQVVGEAQGDESKLDEFLKHLNSGPSAASVNKVDHSDIGVKQGEKGFS